MVDEINHGVIEGRKDTDYVAGVLPYFVRLPSGAWEPFAPPGMRQYNKLGDDMSCVTHSAIESIQTQEKFLTGSAPKYSPRWISVMSGTTDKGNRLDTVMDTIRKVGLVPYEDYPNPPEPWTFEQYHVPIPDDLKAKLLAKGAEWKTRWGASYEWVDISGIYFKDYSNIQKQLMQAPLQVVRPGHAILEIRSLEALMRILNTYEPFVADWQQGSITNAMKILLTPLKGQRMSNARLLKRGPGYGFFLEDINPSSLISSGLHYGVQIPLNPDGSVNFAEVDKLVVGDVVDRN